MKKSFSLFVFIGIVALLQSCSGSKLGGKPPSSFVVATDGGTWSSISIREGLTYEKSFNEVLDVCAKRFEMDVISKEGGYGRSNWIFTWNTIQTKKGVNTKKYRTRVVFKFSADRAKVDIKTEAEFGGENSWIRGYDTDLLQTMKQDIMGVVGRTTM
jgi:hypothetical protein